MTKTEAQSGGVFQDWMNSIMEMWPDWAATQGIEPPAEVVGTPEAVPEAMMKDQSRIAATENPAPSPEDVAATQQQYGVQEVPEEALFPPGVMASSQADVNAAPPMAPPQAPPMMAAIGTALSGIRAPQVPQYNMPSAPGIPGTNNVNATLLQLLQAAGLQAPQASTGLNLSSRIR
jgi:hypothetical protein